LLTAEHKKKLEVLEVDSAKPGDRVYLEGGEVKPLAGQISIERFQEAKISIEDHVVQISGKKLMLDGADIRTQNVVRGMVK